MLEHHFSFERIYAGSGFFIHIIKSSIFALPDLTLLFHKVPTNYIVRHEVIQDVFVT